MKVCMVAYAPYYNDARIKAYVSSLEERGIPVDLLMVREPGKRGSARLNGARIFYQTSQYRGDNPVRYVWSYFVFFLVTLVRLSLLAVRERYTAVHVHNMPNLLVFTAIVPKLLGAKLILDVHDVMPANYMAKFGAGAGHPIVKALVLEQYVSALLAEQVICADHLQKQFLESVCRIPDRKLMVVLNVPNERLFQPVRSDRSDQQFRLVYHGTVARRLGIDILLNAVSKIDPAVPVHLSIYGSGDFLDEARAIAERLRLDGRVSFSGSFFPVEMISQMVGGMDLGVVGNRRTLACDKFMLPVKLLEYVYLGIPVVAPRLEIIRRYFDEGMIKYYEPENVDDLARCIEELYRRPDERRRLVSNAAKFYDQYNWKKQAEAYVSQLAGTNA